MGGATFDLRQNKGLGIYTRNMGTKFTDHYSADEFAAVFVSKYGPIDFEYGIAGASTDFVCCIRLPLVALSDRIGSG